MSSPVVSLSSIAKLSGGEASAVVSLVGLTAVSQAVDILGKSDLATSVVVALRDTESTMTAIDHLKGSVFSSSVSLVGKPSSVASGVIRLAGDTFKTSSANVSLSPGALAASATAALSGASVLSS